MKKNFKKNILPIFNFKNEILENVNSNSVTIITAETGAGKSTQVPQYLLEEGYNIIVTQPRRLAARTVSARVAEEYGCKFGGTVGFRTAHERQDSSETKCLFVTDGLALVRELMNVGRHNILVLDEVHEWNLNIEVLVAWSKLQISMGADFKVVIMSATMEAEKLSNFFDNAPVISVPGRLFPIEEKESSVEIWEDVSNLLREGRNVLVFQPGKAEISDLVSQLGNIKDLNAEILPLHGGLSPEEQAKCFRHYKRPKCIVSTNVAQTSVTIDDIDAVIDSGMERRVELVDGVEGLYLRPISFADAKQRKGRSGRTKNGIYVDHCNYSADDRLDFPKPEILRVRLDQTVLRLAQAGFAMEELDFFHQPSSEEILDAKKSLIGLGCMDKNGKVTSMGRRIARLPISVKFGRMVIEAEKLGVVDDIITITAILEQGGITARGGVYDKDKKYLGDAKSLWRELCPEEEESDVMAQIAIYKKARTMTKEEMRNNGIFIKAYYQAKEKRRHLANSLRGKIRYFSSTGNRENIIKSLCAGMVDHLYQYDYGSYRNGDDTDRELNNSSVISSADWLVGLPFDLEIKTRRGGRITLHLINMATKVNPIWLAEIAPQLIKIEKGISPFVDSESEIVKSTTKTFFNDLLIKEEEVEDANHEEAKKLLADFFKRKEEKRIQQEFERVEREIGHNSWISNPVDVYPYLSKIYQKIEITKSDGGFGEVVYGFVSLYSDSDPDFKILIRKSEEEIIEETKISLKRFLSKSIVLPKEEPWFNGDYKTSLGTALQNRYNSIFEEFELTPNNFLDQLEIVKAKTETICSKLGKEYFKFQELISETSNRLEEIVNSISDGSFIEKEINEVSQFIEEAKKDLKNLAFKNIDELCRKVLEISKNLVLLSKEKAELAQKNEQVKQKVLSSWESISNNLYNIRYGYDDYKHADDEESDNAEKFETDYRQVFAKNRFDDALQIIADAKSFITETETRISNHQQELKKLAEEKGISEHLLNAFGGDIATTLRFVKNVENLPSEKLDSHIVGSCGRGRVRDHLEGLAGEDFFCGADPNDVKYYVYEQHFGENANPVVQKEEKGSYNNNLSTSNDAMAEAFRKAGLV